MDDLTKEHKQHIGASGPVLAFDAAGSACSAALWCDGSIIGHRFETMTRGQSERLMPMIEAVMTEAAVAYEDLAAIAVSRGPGGFTGVRIGLATARALAMASARPLIGVDNFTLLCAGVPPGLRDGRDLLVAIDAKRRDVYAQCFDRDDRALWAPAALSPLQLAERLPPGPLLLIGDGAAQVMPALESRPHPVEVSGPKFADAAVLAALVARRSMPCSAMSCPEPLYLRPPDVTLLGAVTAVDV